MVRGSNGLVVDRACLHGAINDRYGVLRGLDRNLLRGGDMGIVIGILIIAVILWWPRKGGKS